MRSAVEHDFDYETDLLVVGSGGGGLTAALAAGTAGLDVLIVEAASTYGGTTAMSGGAIWIPANPLMAAQGVDDDAVSARTYLDHVIAGRTDAERVAAYLESGPDLVAWLERNGFARFSALAEYADYYPAAPGSRPGGRTLEPKPLDGLTLGAEFERLTEPHPQERILGRVCATAAEARRLLQGGVRGRLLAIWLLLRYALDWRARRRGRRDRRLTLGNALIGHLRRALLQRQVPLWLDSRVSELLVEDGTVIGAVVARAGRAVRVRARRGVVLACGGFAHDDAARRRHQPPPIGSAWTAAFSHDRGDALRLGAAVAAATDLLDDAWWVPTLAVPGDAVPWLLVVEKSLPGCILVDRHGQRFVNEAAPYIDVVNAMLRDRPGAGQAIPAYLVFDARYRRKYPCGPLLPGSVLPDRALPAHLRTWVKSAATLAELAAACGIDRDGLTATVTRFNDAARRGVDPDFHKGDNAYDRYYGDPAVGTNPCLAPLARAPFYAVRVDPGDLGTKGGLLTDADGRVRRTDGTTVPGLYAVGNAAASVMGHTYPGAGGTIGPAMVFGYRAARHAAAAA